MLGNVTMSPDEVGNGRIKARGSTRFQSIEKLQLNTDIRNQDFWEGFDMSKRKKPSLLVLYTGNGFKRNHKKTCRYWESKI